MKKNILFAVLMTLILTVTSIESVSAVQVENKYKECSSNNITEVNVHCFYDENKNRIQDEDERDANNFYVFATDFTELGPGLDDLVGQTDYNGDITFELDTTNGYIISARDTYFNFVYRWSANRAELYYSSDELNLDLYCQSSKSTPKAKNVLNNKAGNVNDDDSTEVTFHCFKDYNDNGVQDPGEHDAAGFYCMYGEFMGFGQDFGQTDNNGDISLDIGDSDYWNCGLMIKARDTYFVLKKTWDSSDVFYPEDLYDGATLDIACKKLKKSKSTDILHTRLFDILEEIGLSNIFVNLF